MTPNSSAISKEYGSRRVPSIVSVALRRLDEIVKSVAAQDELVKDRIAIVDKGVGRLIDADMTEESARLKALQTQQQLGTQALSIAMARLTTYFGSISSAQRHQVWATAVTSN